MTRPVLGVIACNRIVGTEAAQAVMERYIRAAMTLCQCRGVDCALVA